VLILLSVAAEPALCRCWACSLSLLSLLSVTAEPALSLLSMLYVAAELDSESQPVRIVGWLSIKPWTVSRSSLRSQNQDKSYKFLEKEIELLKKRVLMDHGSQIEV
jgi:hypothetical protein